MQIKTTMTCHLSLIGMIITKMSTNNKCWRGVEKREPSYIVGENVNLYSHYGEGASLVNQMVKNQAAMQETLV